jgi:hypothetical protein
MKEMRVAVLPPLLRETGTAATPGTDFDLARGNAMAFRNAPLLRRVSHSLSVGTVATHEHPI